MVDMSDISLADMLNFRMVVDPYTSNVIVKSSTDRKKLISSHIGFLQAVASKKAALSGTSGFATRISTSSEIHSAYPDVKLTPENAIDIATLSQYPTKVVTGKFLLCRTIIPADQYTGIMTLVEDPRGKNAVTVALYNYSTSVAGVTKYDYVLPTGTLLAIKNPWFKAATSGVLVVRCDDPSQVEILSKKAVKAMFPGVTWRGEIPSIPFFPNEDFWRKVKGTERQTFEALKKLGNVGFVEKRFTDAIRWYKLALDYAGTDDEVSVDILSNRAAAFLSLRCFHRALEDTEKVLKVKESHVKGIYRKTKALMGLGKYEEAANFVCEKMKKYDELMENKDLQQLLISAKGLVSQLKSDVVDVDMMKLIKVNQAAEYNDDAFQFTGPVEKKLLNDGKGRGLVVTQDVHPGQLLMSSKAFALVKLKTNEIKGFNVSMNSGSQMISGPEYDALVAQIANKIYLEPEESGPEIYSLFAGHELGYLSENSQENRSVSIKRIGQIILQNMFHSGTDIPGVTFHSIIKAETFATLADPHTHTYSGIWILPSLLNHSCCDCNAIWTAHGDFLIIRAFKPIKKGEEILISYIPANSPYEDRMDVFRSRSFVCQCRLCKLDEVDTKNGKEKTRSLIMDKLEALMGKFENNPQAVKKAMGYITELETMRKDSLFLNTCLARSYAVQMVAESFSETEKPFEGFLVLLKVYCLEKENGLILRAIVTAMNILRIQIAMQDTDGVNQWINLLKQDLTAGCGSIEPMKILGPKELQELKEICIDFFQE